MAATTDLDAQLTAVLLLLPVTGEEEGEGTEKSTTAPVDLREWLVHADAALFHRSVDSPPPRSKQPSSAPRAGEDMPSSVTGGGGALTEWGQAALLRIMEATMLNRRLFVAPVVEWLKGRALPTVVDYIGPPNPERDLVLSLLSSFMDLCLTSEEAPPASGRPSTAAFLPAPKRARTEQEEAEKKTEEEPMATVCDVNDDRE